jgi:hypothetical protein
MPVSATAPNLKLIRSDRNAQSAEDRLKNLLNLLGIPENFSNRFPASVPFSLNDATVGVENELQTVVMGDKDSVDLPIFIKDSNYYKNIGKRSGTGDTSKKFVFALDAYLDNNPGNVWENSWVRFPRSVLSATANRLFNEDVAADKTRPMGPKRGDTHRFSYIAKGIEYIRIPVSYLLKLALADAVCPSHSHAMTTETGNRLMQHFLNDNTSPETFSFTPVPFDGQFQGGKGIARETLKRFILSQFLVIYANRKFKLKENGQRAMVYFAPNTPIRQKMLNDFISDSFYRELFMSPCLSGWDRGEDKYRYMVLCHQVLSRSQLNAVVKLKEAGIITNNLVTLAGTSNTSLANNGTHISLGSRKLTGLLSDKKSGFVPADEKFFGDLAIKIIEHFLPLFVGTFSAAPYRMDFNDFHPEKALGFLPHELDFTHLRMIWRRWKKKAHLSLLSRPITPFGPEWLDRGAGRLLSLKGDFVNDFRLIDYLVCLMSTDESPALNGRLGNAVSLKKDLSDLGIFDASMSLYLLYRLREFETMGFSGFEGRHYSQFASVNTDLAQAANLQCLITAFAYKCMLLQTATHHTIPDDPFLESERRQIFFGAAIGIPTFYVKIDTPNRFLARIVKKTKNVRRSRRYGGYWRVLQQDYCRALIEILETRAADLIEMMDMKDTMADLKNRIYNFNGQSAAGKLTRGILNTTGVASPFKLNGREFNIAAERYYRGDLRAAYIHEAFETLEEDFICLDSWQTWREGKYNKALFSILDGKSPKDFLRSVKDGIVNETITEEAVRKLIQLTLLTIHRDIEAVKRSHMDAPE